MARSFLAFGPTNFRTENNANAMQSHLKDYMPRMRRRARLTGRFSVAKLLAQTAVLGGASSSRKIDFPQKHHKIYACESSHAARETSTRSLTRWWKQSPPVRLKWWTGRIL